MSGQSLPAATELTRPATETRLRLWPGVAILSVLAIARVVAAYGADSPAHFFLGYVITPMVCLMLLLLWWLFASRLRWADRLLVVGTFVSVTAATALISGQDFPLLGLIFYATPLIVLNWVVWLVLTQGLNWPFRRMGLLAVIAATGAFFCLLRVDGMDGVFNAKFSWRWTPTPEQRMLAELQKTNAVATTTPDSAGQINQTQGSDRPTKTVLEAKAGDWPEFRGPDRDSRLTGIQIQTDFAKSPPKELWRHRIGPGWSSFAVVGDLVFTQEQRGEDELVVCYNAETGKEVWTHTDQTRFYEIIAGAGPRSTPTFYEGRLYTLGANGRLNCLDPATGSVIWTRDIAADSGAKPPTWGFSSSPLVVNGIVTVFAGGPEGKSVLGYKTDSGDLAWSGGDGKLSYASTQLATLDGIPQLLMFSEVGLSSFEPQTGKLLWQHEWPSGEIARVVQPAIIGQSDILLGTGMGIGTRRITVKHTGDKWETTEGWTSRAFKPYYNDFVVVQDHLYGFDGPIFLCVALEDGRVKWRARGYGNGQVLLLADQDLLLVLTEQGEVVLVSAKPEKHEEISRFKAVEGKTWNHPVIAHGKLFVRNAEEVAAFQLPLLSTAKPAETKTEPVASVTEPETKPEPK